MHAAILIWFAVCVSVLPAAAIGGPLVKVDLDSGPAYIVPESYAGAHKSELKASLLGTIKMGGFWTPTEVDVIVANRVFRELIQNAEKDPALLFPDLVPSADSPEPARVAAAAQLENERYELSLVSSHYELYSRQFAGIIVDGKKLILCNYFVGPKFDPSADYIFIQKVFAVDGSVHFLQCQFDPDLKSCSNVSMVGSWQTPAK